ncbi:tumor protein D52 isoform X2 [Canis lupus dingo]|uniref:tumor protein D52 isoform X2 n=1 Tax=Canis lupus dingo TaxID=286419 RepID=UPI0020C2144C|nr:tumor protein D52 isoform X2 [Canis lupus dingo]
MCACVRPCVCARVCARAGAADGAPGPAGEPGGGGGRRLWAAARGPRALLSPVQTENCRPRVLSPLRMGPGPPPAPASPGWRLCPRPVSVLRVLGAFEPRSSGFGRLCVRGLLRTDPVPEEGEDVVATIGATETLSEEEQEELRRELAKVEEEIQTLSQVLAAKEKHLAEIKRKLGINSLQELKQNIAKGWQDVTATSAYKKTSETLSQAGQKASAAFSSVGSVITKKLEDVNIRSIQHSISMPAMRNSPTFKSFEEKVENLKSKVGGTKPAGGDFGEVLNSTANASATAPEPLPEQTQASP